MKKILVLGAMQMHVPLLKRAKERGLYVITCDYIPDNIGHKYADKPYYESTTDFDAVLNIAKEHKIDGILTYNSDPAAPTAARVAEQLNLLGSGYDAVKIMSEKDLFRDFLQKNKFNVPHYNTYSNSDILKQDLNNFSYPVLLKPVDSSGSKGVVILNNASEIEAAFTNAMQYSRCKRVIIEEYIEAKTAQLHGDAFVADNKIQFIYLGDHHYNTSINGLVPYSTTFPSSHLESDIRRVEKEVERFIKLVGFKQGGINIEARISAKDNEVYLIEVGPRNGGNFTPKVIQYASGFNFVDALLDAVLGVPFTARPYLKKGFYAYLILHSECEGKLKSVEIDTALSSKILEEFRYVPKEGNVLSFRGANAAIGVLLLKFSSMKEMQYYVTNFANYNDIEIDD